MDKKEVTEQDLAQAFAAEEVVEEPTPETNKKTKKAKGGKKSPAFLISIIMMAVGVVLLIAGVVLLVLDLTRGPIITDGEYLMLAEEWVLSDGTNCASSGEPVVSAGESVETGDLKTDGEATNGGGTNCIPGVYWKFTEVGKGTLTTNNHINDYDFLWAIEDGKLKIETKWLYDLENEYDYEINRNEKTLILRDGEKQIVFVGHFTDAE
ncbi:MAG: DUF5640 domain-containing protein [Candidatus Saccharibacteria bacterium]|nr:DUF5640 domain-containing protein [Candidatus Saccharibacteria bacterium]